MTDAQQREAARQFYYKWNGKGREDEDARSYWIDILQDVFGIDHVTDRVDFEKKVIGADGNTKRIDVYIPETRVLIEQKSLGIALDKPQAGHGGKTSYEQAKEYDNGLPYDEKARWIVTSNFAEIWIYDMNEKKPAPVKLLLSDLQSKYHMLDFLINRKTKKISDEMQISLQAGEIVGLLYDAFHKQYKNPDDPETLKSLNKLCVRIVFCLYAEDAGVFGRKSMFHDYMEQFDAAHARKGLRELFRVLNRKPEERDPYLADDDPMLAAFPYVNGGLFADDDIEIPPFTDEIMNLILRKAADDFDWSGISPTIFGAVFESTLNPETRRSGGMHYTSIENIHKVIDPLFLDDLKAELEEIKKDPVLKSQKTKLQAYQNKLASLEFLDPAAGSGNFLTESYICLRRLENEALRLMQSQVAFGDAAGDPVRVSISQFHGIEINDFAVTVAKTALWIAESQMLKETEDIVLSTLDFLPLKTNANIVEANALRIDWNDVVPKERLNYIMGNPPFVGKKEQTKGQKQDLSFTFPPEKKRIGNLDYVSGWFYKASCVIKENPIIKAAFVSTDSLCQGEHVPNLWELLIDRCHIKIFFAHRTFKWDSEATDKAEVYCVIVGFASNSYEPKNYAIYEGNKKRIVSHISPYLIDAPDVWFHARADQLSNASKIYYGSMPIDDGALIVSEGEYEELKIREPNIIPYILPYAGAEELLKGKKRYCLWLKDASRKEIINSAFLSKRVAECKAFRLKSNRDATKKLADRPELFGEIRQPSGKMIVIPKVSSKHRTYIPLLFIDSKQYIINGSSLIIPTEDLYLFGILSSNVHNAWLRAIAETWGHSFQYSTDIYNNFPFPDTDESQRQRIIQTAEEIIKTRNQHPDLSLADMYSPKLGVISDLAKAHQANDKAVMQAYGMPIKDTDEAACVAWLMRLYQEKVGKQ